jgi:polyhydroxyalkanoate synthase
VNAPNIIDLHQEHSMVQRLIESGHTVYLLDWGEISDEDKDKALSTYISDYIDAAVNCVRSQTRTEKINLLGICQGGTFALCYASLKPEKINRLVTLVTPVDFHAGNSILTQWVKYIDFSLLEENPRNVPGEVITALFQIIRPFNDLQRQVQLIDQPAAERKLELTTLMDQWVFHCPDQPGRAFAQFIKLFFQENRLVENRLILGEENIRLSNITAPVLNVYAEFDHLVPAASAGALTRYISREYYNERIFAGGHIGLLVSTKAQQTILPQIGSWLAEPI